MLFLLAKYGFGLWAQWNNLCSSCAWLAKPVRVTEGRMKLPSVFALLGVGIAGYGPPQAQGGQCLFELQPLLTALEG